MLASAAEPAAERGFRGRKDPRRSASAKSFHDRRERLCDAGRGSLQSIEWGVPTGGDLPLAGLAEEILDQLVAAVITVANQSVDSRVGDPEVLAIGIGTA
jgi:hypothetical protein